MAPTVDKPAYPTLHDLRGRLGLVWIAGLLVAVGAGVATAHGLYEVALAAGVPKVLAWLYPIITDGLALVAYATTTRLGEHGRRYAWVVVVVAAGLSGLTQAGYLAGGVKSAPAVLRFALGAWPAVAAAIVAHLLYLLSQSQDHDSRDELPHVPVTPPQVDESRPAAVAPFEGLSEKSVTFSGGAHLRGDIGAGADLQRSLHSAGQPTTQTPLRLVPPTADAAPIPAPPVPAPPRPERPAPPNRSRAQTDTVNRRGGPVQAKAVRYLVKARRRGVDLSTITPADLAAAIGGKVDTCRRNLDAWRQEALNASEVTA